MSAIVLGPTPNFTLRSFAARLRRDEPRFFGLGLLLAVAMLPTGFAALVDGRTFLDINVWDKVLKFELALVIYLLTLAFFARFLPRGTTDRTWYRVYSSVVAGAIVLEMVWIAGASALGTASHFNATPLGDMLFSAAGLAAVLLTSPSAVYAVLVGRNRQTGLSPALREAVVLGLALVLPLTLITAGTMASMGAHQVGGVATDAGGLAVMGWSRVAGDLRVAHFFATHALHFIPAFGVASVLAFGGERRAPVRLFTLVYILLVGFTFVQALQGRPFLPMLG
jgi:hypothetical protein